MSTFVLENVEKRYKDGSNAVKDFNLKIDEKEFIVLVGPSGCGKSTTLRMIAGLEEISEGTFQIGGNVVNDVPSKNRDIAMVFQNYALYPHLTVYDNMAFGLKLRKIPKQEIKMRVDEAAKILGLETYLDRKPKHLSGGQRQRVALGRAIVRDAKLFLMDEPLSNLDAKLRVQMRAEITKLHNRLNTTTIYVTHDQTEAMTMATRLVVMKDGVIQQIGTPKEVYNHPDNVFVGGFIGSPSMNFFKATVSEEGLHIGSVTLDLPEDKRGLLARNNKKNTDIIFGIRPEHISTISHLHDVAQAAIAEVDIEVAELTGSEKMLYAQIDEQNFVARVDADFECERNDQVKLVFDLSRSHFFDSESELRLV